MRTLAKAYAVLSDEQMSRLVEDKNLMEICDGDEEQV